MNTLPAEIITKILFETYEKTHRSRYLLAVCKLWRDILASTVEKEKKLCFYSLFHDLPDKSMTSINSILRNFNLLLPADKTKVYYILSNYSKVDMRENMNYVRNQYIVKTVERRTRSELINVNISELQFMDEFFRMYTNGEIKMTCDTIVYKNIVLIVGTACIYYKDPSITSYLDEHSFPKILDKHNLNLGNTNLSFIKKFIFRLITAREQLEEELKK
jgi:hypothetical protein